MRTTDTQQKEDPSRKLVELLSKFPSHDLRQWPFSPDLETFQLIQQIKSASADVMAELRRYKLMSHKPSDVSGV